MDRPTEERHQGTAGRLRVRALRVKRREEEAVIELHHRSGQVASEHLDAAVELFTEILGLKEIFRLPGTSFLQADTGPVAIQLIARPALRAQEKKQLSHLGFVSDNPEQDRERIREFFASRGFATTLGQWSPRELWLDAPEVFYDFVIEVFDRTLLEEVIAATTADALKPPPR